MRITLIEQHEYDMLMKVQAEHPNLTYQNKGYDYPDKSKWTPEDLEAFKKCEDFLKQCIKGFREFNHFILRNSGKWVSDFNIIGLQMKKILINYHLQVLDI